MSAGISAHPGRRRHNVEAMTDPPTDLADVAGTPLGEAATATEPEPDAPTPPAELPRRRVLMAAAGRTVEVEAPDDLDAVAFLAMELWKITDDPRVVKGHSTSVGFFTETAPTDQAAYAPDDDRDRTIRPPGIGRPG
jgi:hypothetical protein